MKIRTQIDKESKKISASYKKIRELQELCPHPKDKVTEKYGSNTGGYDGPAYDSYWIDYCCKDCDKTWRTDQ